MSSFIPRFFRIASERILVTIGGPMSWFRNVLRRPTARDGFVDSTQDEQDLTNFRVLTDYVTSLLQSWVSWEEGSFRP